jgi:hypothetical protein
VPRFPEQSLRLLIYRKEKPRPPYVLADDLLSRLVPRVTVGVMFSFPQYEMHYQGAHVYSCVECRRAFPSNRLLEVGSLGGKGGGGICFPLVPTETVWGPGAV